VIIGRLVSGESTTVDMTPTLRSVTCSRRICPGARYADREIWLALSRMLWAFKMDEIPGEPIDLKEYDGLSGRSPVPFRIRIIPRHDLVAEVLGV